MKKLPIFPKNFCRQCGYFYSDKKLKEFTDNKTTVYLCKKCIKKYL
jgi:hypothetical protein